MGPRLASRGNLELSGNLDTYGDASMGPRLASRGNDGTVRVQERRLRASMGPRLASRGNPPGGKFCVIDTELQWGRGSRAAETKGRGNGGRATQCFNGAAAREPRKLPVAQSILRGGLANGNASVSRFSGFCTGDRARLPLLSPYSTSTCASRACPGPPPQDRRTRVCNCQRALRHRGPLTAAPAVDNAGHRHGPGRRQSGASFSSSDTRERSFSSS